MIEGVEITTKGIRKTLAGMSPEKAIAEYIWNGFDAAATTVRVEARPATVGMEIIHEITISDNGTGIRFDELNTKFKPYLESAKAARKSNIKTSHERGEEGKGRLSFCVFAKTALWSTVYVEKGKRFGYTIKVKEETLSQYEPSEKKEVDGANGTTVLLTGISDEFTTHVVENVLKNFLRTEFCWYLRLNEKAGKAIILNGVPLDYRSLMLDTESRTITHPESGVSFQIDFIQWEKKQEEYSKLYFLNEAQDEKFKQNSRFNNKGDHFYHSLYVTSRLFKDVLIATSSAEPDDTMTLSFEANQRKAFNFLLTETDTYLRGKRREFLAGTSDQFVQKLYADNVAPQFKNNDYDKIRKQDFENVVKTVYETDPRFFTGLSHEQNKTLLGFLNLLLDSDERDSVLEVLQQVVTLNPKDLADLRSILRCTQLNRVIALLQLIKDRVAAVEMLKKLVFVEELKANEVKDIQSAVESHYWLFGEEYNLVTAAEPNFEEALRRFREQVYGDGEKMPIDHPDRLKQMDIFAIRQSVGSRKVESIVVELKHPKITLGEKELSQVKRYMSVILAQPDFNGNNREWRLYLVGKSYNDHIAREMKTNAMHGEPDLVFKYDNYRIYVKQWDDVFVDFDIRHKHLHEKLSLDRSKISQEIAGTKSAIGAALQASTAGKPS